MTLYLLNIFSKICDLEIKYIVKRVNKDLGAAVAKS
jgi:hypothetical protein